MKDESVFLLVALGITAVGLLIYAVGNTRGAKDACATVHAEWRDGKCVRVVVEEVK